MVSVLTKTTAALLAQLARLDALAVEDAEKVKAECDRATALNNTARNIQGMLDLHLRAEMLQMNGYDRFFDPGAMFADAPKAAGGGLPDGERLGRRVEDYDQRDGRVLR